MITSRPQAHNIDLAITYLKLALMDIKPEDINAIPGTIALSIMVSDEVMRLSTNFVDKTGSIMSRSFEAPLKIAK